MSINYDAINAASLESIARALNNLAVSQQFIASKLAADNHEEQLLAERYKKADTYLNDAYIECV